MLLCHMLALSLVFSPLHAFQPLVINTWEFTDATDSAWETLSSGGSAVAAVVAGCSHCEFVQCDGSVGFGNSPDENGETTLDAMVMDGSTHDMGAVMGLRGVKNAIGVAEAVLKYTQHSILVGGLATEFASQMGFPVENLTSEGSQSQWESWKLSSCQPNFWKDVLPDPQENCGPYSPPGQLWTGQDNSAAIRALVTEDNHDTIGMVAIDENGDVAVGTSTNGLLFKIPGRVGDTAVVGAGGYADNFVGGAAATGDGDILVRFLPSYRTVEYMRQGLSPSEAAGRVFDEMLQFYPGMMGGVVSVDLEGNLGGACSFTSSFSFSYRFLNDTETTVGTIECV